MTGGSATRPFPGIVVDVVNEAGASCGANEDGKHLKGVNWERDLPAATAADLRKVVDGDPSPDGKGTLSIELQEVNPQLQRFFGRRSDSIAPADSVYADRKPTHGNRRI